MADTLCFIKVFENIFYERMYIIDKNNVPEEIVNDDTKFMETTFLLFIYEKLPVNEVDEYFQKYNKSYDLHEFLERIPNLKKYFENLDDRSLKASQSSFMRYFVRDLKKKVVFKGLSQNDTKRIVSSLIGEIVFEGCKICCYNLFREKYMELFEESCQTEHLKNEFESIVILLLQPMWDGRAEEMSSIQYSRFILYKEIHGRYLVELISDDPDIHLLSKYKQQLQEIIEMDEDEADEKGYAKDREEIKRYQKFEQTVDDFIDHHEHDENTIDYDLFQEDVAMLAKEHENEMNKQSIMKSDQRIQKIYQQYFQYGKDDYENYYKEINVINNMLIRAVRLKFTHFMQYLFVLYISRIADEVSDQMDLKLMIDQYFVDVKKYSSSFLHLLAFHLWNDGSEKDISHKIKAFQSVVDEIPVCHETFLDFQEERDSEEYVNFDTGVFPFTPEHLYFNHIVMAVIVNINDPAVARRLKAIILSSYKSFDIAKKSKEYTQSYETDGLKKDFHALHECANLYILSYLKDKKLLATYTPFLRYFNDCYLTMDGIISDYSDETVSQRKYIQINQEFEKIWERYHEAKYSLKLPKLDEVEYLMNIYGKSLLYFNPVIDYESLLKTHQNRLVNYIADHRKEFFKKSFVDQIDQLLSICLFYHYVDTIDHYDKYMPRRNQIVSDEYIDSLQSIIEDKEHIIDIKNEQLENMKPQKINKQHENQNYLDEIKYYRQEISTLNKQLKNKDIEIENLRKNQDELYKLRELIFEMHQEDHTETTKNIDLYEVIQDKTIIIIGGHISLRDRLKQKYPSLKILSRSSHITDAVLLHADHVFMFYKFMTHDMYNRAISVLSRNNISWDYVPYTNLEKAEEIIYHILKA